MGPLADDGGQTLARWRQAYARHSNPQHAPRVYPTVDAAVAARVAAGGLDSEETRPIVERNLAETAGGFVWRSDARLRMATPVRIEELQVRRLLTGIEAPTLLLLAEPQTPYLPNALIEARVACVGHIRVERIAGPHHLHIHCTEQIVEYASGFLRHALH